jgi:hypothetical protein
MRRPDRQDQGVPYRGIAGGPDKVRICRDEFRYDCAVDYKAGDLEPVLDGACPDGVDVYFDNTAGPVSDSVMRRLTIGARVVICGTASVASWDPPPRPVRPAGPERSPGPPRSRSPGPAGQVRPARSPAALPIAAVA